MAQDWQEQLIDIAGTIEPDTVQLDPLTIPLAAEILHDIDLRYGPESDSPRAHHNASHGRDVARRIVVMTNILYPYLNAYHRPKIYDLAILIGVTHDFEQDKKSSGANERASAREGVRRISELDSPLNNGKFKQRLELGVMATAVIFRPDGEIIQTNLRRNSRDPIKLAAAYGDINGIAMEGGPRMFRDASNLCREQQKDPSPEDQYNFLLTQAGFLKQRLNDHQVKADIAYYFPDDTEDIYDDLHQAFNSNIVSAYRMAVALNDHPDLKKTIERMVGRIGSHRSGAIGKAILDRIAADK